MRGSCAGTPTAPSSKASPRPSASSGCRRTTRRRCGSSSARFEENVVVEVDGLGPVRFCHGSPRSDEECVTPETPEERVREFSAGVDERVIVSAHVHIQFDREVGRDPQRQRGQRRPPVRGQARRVLGAPRAGRGAAPHRVRRRREPSSAIRASGAAERRGDRRDDADAARAARGDRPRREARLRRVGGIASIRGAAAWVDRVGLAALFPTDDLVLPSLWEAVTGKPVVDRDFAPDVALVWGWKDELPEPEARLRGEAPRRPRLARLARAAARPLRAHGPERAAGGLPRRGALARRAGRRRGVARVRPDQQRGAAEPRRARAEARERGGASRLQRRLVLTAAGRQEHERGWPSVVFDILPRRYADRLDALPDAGRRARRSSPGRSCARRAKSRPQTSPRCIGGTRKQAAAALDRLAAEGRARQRDAGEYLLWAL